MIRTVLWLGAPVIRARVDSTPFALKLLEVSRGPELGYGAGGDDWRGLSEWLGRTLPPGSEVDVVYQHHLLRVETFPRLPAADRDDALRVRMRRDFLQKPGDLLCHAVWLDAAGQTQAVLAAVLEETYQTTCRALGELGCRAGRVGFAGQLALLELQRQAGRGGWLMLENMAGAASLLLVRDAEGLLMAAALPRDASAIVPERLALWQPRRSKPLAPIALSARASARRDAAPDLPAPLPALIAAFARQSRWRLASKQDLEYPFHFGIATWAAAAVCLALLLHAGSLGLELRRLSASAVEQAKLDTEFRSLLDEAKALARRQSGMEVLERQMQGLAAEPFDNAAWMRFIGAARDRCAGPLLFDSVSVQSAQVMLTGAQDRVEPVLRFYECLATLLGDASVKLARLDTEASGRCAFVLEIDRHGPAPPRLPGS